MTIICKICNFHGNGYGNGYCAQHSTSCMTYIDMNTNAKAIYVDADKDITFEFKQRKWVGGDYYLEEK